jgi:hypothetical protein
MKRLKGPELKMPEMKVPPFLSDLYWDLRDRRLLPLVALAIVAIIAVPILLGGKSGAGSSPNALTITPPATATGGSSSSKLVAVKANPGLRNYHKRLSHRSPTDPFKQRYTAPQVAELAGEEGSSTSSTSTSTSTSSTTEGGGGSTTHVGSETSESGGAPPAGGLRLYTFAADVKIVRSETKPDGTVVHGEPTVRHRVVAPAPLPDEKTSVVAYMGMDKNHKPLLLVSDAVTGVFGEGKCLSGASTCQLLEVETGMPVTFVYGEGGNVRYKITVLKVEPVHVGKF